MLAGIPLEGERSAHDPTLRGYSVAYREDQVNHCSGRPDESVHRSSNSGVRLLRDGTTTEPELGFHG
jgi:hypothetical protein